MACNALESTVAAQRAIAAQYSAAHFFNNHGIAGSERQDSFRASGNAPCPASRTFFLVWFCRHLAL
jgi:Tfp pilus assembly protein PilX